MANNFNLSPNRFTYMRYHYYRCNSSHSRHDLRNGQWFTVEWVFVHVGINFHKTQLHRRASFHRSGRRGKKKCGGSNEGRIAIFSSCQLVLINSCISHYWLWVNVEKEGRKEKSVNKKSLRHSVHTLGLVWVRMEGKSNRVCSSSYNWCCCCCYMSNLLHAQRHGKNLRGH